MQYSLSLLLKAAAAGAVALAALLAGTAAHAGGGVSWSVGVHAAPGVVFGATNAPVYAAPVYQPNYYVQAVPNYVPPPILYVPPVVYPTAYYAPPVYWRAGVSHYGGGHGHGKGHGKGHGHGHGNGHRR
ncbi:hypothetical protein [uncultured Ramlibacter sp.]|uniref:hypothetical protein n=1 Tax=uncultured Ramlibacter sp. TaxID=260755 RepID=UPI00261CE4B2|nr:hypothetical protein [uncultured Ramlibacter sp.]